MCSKRSTAVEAAPKIAKYEELLGRALSRSERAAVMKTAVLKTRPSKTHSEASALHATWTADAAQAGWTEQRLHHIVPTEPWSNGPDLVGSEQGRVLTALQAAGQRRAVFSRDDVAGQIAARLPTTGPNASARRRPCGIQVPLHPQGTVTLAAW